MMEVHGSAAVQQARAPDVLVTCSMAEQLWCGLSERATGMW